MVLLASLTVPSTALAQTEEPVDRQALMELFASTDGDGWDRSGNWGSNLPLDRWHGVTTDSTGRVVSLELPSNGLFGPIPAALGALEGREDGDLAETTCMERSPP
ncbi:MAG: hypothetical protein F4072_09800, partial [Acidimicrobiaceae bacterium]|nr:hypothetical protein [Acidimicrobiaceae bacterium]